MQVSKVTCVHSETYILLYLGLLSDQTVVHILVCSVHENHLLYIIAGSPADNIGVLHDCPTLAIHRPGALHNTPL